MRKPKKMNPEIKAKWLEALRAGDYKQGRGFLHAVDKNGVDRFCCLGVLTDLYIKDHNKVRWSAYDKLRTGRTPFGFDSDAEYPSRRVCEWSGLPESSPTIVLRELDPFGHLQNSDLASLNDSRKTFATIAKYIEEQL